MSRRRPPMYDGRKTRFDPERKAILDALDALRARLDAPPPRPTTPEMPKPPERPTLPEGQIQTLLKMAEASLRQYGEIVPPKEVFYVTGEQECPHCGETKSIATEFGFKRSKGGEVSPQSWCRTCRNSPDSHPGRVGGGRRRKTK